MKTTATMTKKGNKLYFQVFEIVGIETVNALNILRCKIADETMEIERELNSRFTEGKERVKQ